MSDSAVFKVSLPGYDVKTATPEQCSIHSGYNTMKIKLDVNNPQFGNILVTFVDNPAAGTYPIYIINHNYGYIPAYYLFFNTQLSYKVLSVETGNFFSWDAGESLYFQAVVDTEKIVFSCVVTPTFVANVATFPIINQFFAFRFYVFAETGV